MLRSLAVLALAVAALPAAAQEQEILFPGQTGAQLLASIRAAYTPTSVTGRNDDLYARIDSMTVDGTLGVVCVYTGYVVPFDCNPSCDPSQDVFNGGGSTGINQEHTYPQSRLPSGAARSDLHNLFPTRVDVNGARGNLPFGEIQDALTTRWYRDAGNQSTAPPLAERDGWSELRSSVAFEPREDHEGNAARAMFYMRAIWATNDAAWFDGQVDDLYDWHRADPVTQADVDRSARVAAFQRVGSREIPNPFVVDSTLARRAFFPSPPTSTEAGPEGGLVLRLAGPNPVSGETALRLRAPAGETVHLEAFDALGRRVALLHEGPAPAGLLRVRAADLPSGLLLLRATTGSASATLPLAVAR